MIIAAADRIEGACIGIGRQLYVDGTLCAPEIADSVEDDTGVPWRWRSAAS
jgi:hypothetical protein